VSNNSDRAVRAYLTQHGLDDRVSYIAARTSTDPALLKPSPYLIQQTIAGLDAEPGECALVRDTVTDIEATCVSRPTAGAAASLAQDRVLGRRSAFLPGSLNWPAA
jgi:phosphoglycolate phosphatase